MIAEKVEGLRQLYIEEKTVFKLQELEKLAPKKKGISEFENRDF
jgi:hypothetical protein